MARDTTRDLTEGNPLKLILSFSVPVLFGLLFQQMYSFVDTAIVGRTLGSEALGAVGDTGALNFLILGFCTGTCSGFSIPIAQSFGAHDEQNVRRYTWNNVYVSAAIAVVFGVVTGLLSRQFLIWMNTPASLLDMANDYISAIFWGIPVCMLYNAASGVLRSLGDSRTPVLYLILASLINIGLDLLFILTFHMGVFGAALATLISQLISGIGCVVTMVRRFTILRSTADDRAFRPLYAKNLLAIGAPMGLQFSITAVGSVIIQTAVNGLGEIAVTAVTAANKVHMLFACVLDSMGTTMATYCGQNRGAGKPDRIREGILKTLIICTVYSMFAHVVLVFTGRWLLSLFITGNSSTEIIELAQHYLIVQTMFYIPLLLIYVLRSSIQGMGFTREAMYAGLFELVGRSSIAFLGVPAFGFDAACFSSPCAWVLAAAYLVYCYFTAMKKIRKRMKQTANPV